jgi:plasmid stabilization system protein ParE
MKIVFAPEARAEFADAARWYAKEAGAKQARDFKDEVHRILAL